MNTIYMMIGLPGSGKSTYAQTLIDENTVYVSSDKIREELFGNESVQSNPELVFTTLHKRIKEAIKEGKNAIYDATNLSSKRRVAFLREIKRFNVEKVAVIVPTPLNDCIKNDSERERTVGSSVIRNMYMNFQSPHITEGWDRIKLITTDRNKRVDDMMEILSLATNMEQNNSHHTLTLLGHVNAVSEYVHEHSTDKALQLASMAHDIGKPFTKSFVNSKGFITTEAHYYKHENVGSYIILEHLSGYDKKELTLDIAFYVGRHMENKSVKMEERKKGFVKKYGQKYADNLEILMTGDELAH